MHDKSVNQAMARDYLARARAGQLESAFFNLIELDESVLLVLEQEFRAEKDASIRSLIVEAIWHYRSAASVPFLLEAMKDSDNAVWNHALDGLVAMASVQTQIAVQSCLKSETQPKRRVLLQEAFEQIQESILAD